MGKENTPSKEELKWYGSNEHFNTEKSYKLSFWKLKWQRKEKNLKLK